MARQSDSDTSKEAVMNAAGNHLEQFLHGRSSRHPTQQMAQLAAAFGDVR